MICRAATRAWGSVCARRRAGKTRVLVVAGICVLAAVVLAPIYLRFRSLRSGGEPAVVLSLSPAEVEAVQSQVTVFCGNCHAVPSPASFPKAAWHEEVSRGFDFYMQSGRTDLDVPPLERIVTYFRSRAPDEIVVPPAKDDPAPAPIRFRASASPVHAQNGAEGPWIASLRWDVLASGSSPVLLACDMGNGNVRAGRTSRREIVFSTLARLDNPARAVPVDLDADGKLDLVVADLGSRLPADHDHGRVVWLRRTGDEAFETIVIQSGLGRVADVEPGDFDGDGDVDLIVAEFGWHETGRILLLDQQPCAGSTPHFELRVIDPRPGTIHVPTADLNGDGRLDFVALISQEHETVEAFLNDGHGHFQRETIFAAGDPAFGSSGIELVDLDRDGDLDVLYTNGDTFDSFYLKPYHGIRWLENRGDGSFAVHHLAAMPGVHRALAGDLDGDGDRDIAACSLIPGKLLGRQPDSDFDAVMWLEQTAPGKFARHSLQRGGCRYAALALGDFDGDGDLDLAVGGFSEPSKIVPEATVWWNEGRSAP